MPATTGGVLVIGGCGRVGRLIAPYLEARPLNFWSFGSVACPGCDWAGHVVGDVCDLGDVFLAARGKSAIVYVAMGGPDAASLFEVGVHGFYNVLLAAMETCVSRVVLASSMSVYDDWAEASIGSEERPAYCDDPYGVVKVLAEDLGRHFAQAYGMSVIALRLASPMTDQDAMRNQARPRGNHHALGALKVAEAFAAALALRDHVGFDAVHVTGQTDGDQINQEKAKRLLGWEP